MFPSQRGGHTRIFHYEVARVLSAAWLSERTRDFRAGNSLRDRVGEARPDSRPRRTTGAMRLEVKRCGNVHSELVAAVGWNAENELYSCGDDKQIARWNANGDAGGKVRRHAATSLARARVIQVLDPCAHSPPI